MKSLGKFEILERIGQGAMGIVYKARDPRIGRLVALKTITTGLAEDPAQLQRFYHEAHSAGALQHPNIVTIYELGEEDHTPFIAMEYLSGQSLNKVIEGHQKLPLSRRIGYVSYVCRALAYAHKQGVIHRDIKPANVMVTGDGTVKVVDFGIARIAESSHSQTGMLAGTPAYMSPQQVEGGHADARSDIWAAGVLFYELLANRRPFDGESYSTVILNILRKDIPPLSKTAPGTPPDVVELVDVMLRKDIDERYQSMEEVLIDLEPVWRRLQNAEVSDLLASSRELFKAGDLGKAYEMVRRVLQIDTANAAAKSLLEQINAEMWKTQSAPAPAVESKPMGDETLIGPAIGVIVPRLPGVTTPTASRPQKGSAPGSLREPVSRLRAPDARRTAATRTEEPVLVPVPAPVPVPPPAPAQVRVHIWQQPIPIALLVLTMMATGGGIYFIGFRHQGASSSETSVTTTASEPSTTSRSSPSAIAPPVSHPASGNTVPTEVDKGQPTAITNSAGGNARPQEVGKKSVDTNTPARVSPPVAPVTPTDQGKTGQGVAQGTAPPALDHTEMAANNPVPPPAAERPSQPVAVATQPAVPPTPPPVLATPVAAKVADPSPPTKAIEPPVASSGPPDNLDRQAITISLQQLSAAFSHRSVAELGELWPKLPKDDRNTYKRAFDSAKSIRREFHLQSLNISGDGGLATAIGTYEGAVQDGRGVETPNSGNFYVRFAKKNGRWYVDEARF